MIHSSPFGGFMGVDAAGAVFAGPLGKDAAANDKRIEQW